MDITIYSAILRRIILSELSRRQGETIVPQSIVEISDEIIRAIEDYNAYCSPSTETAV